MKKILRIDVGGGVHNPKRMIHFFNPHYQKSLNFFKDKAQCQRIEKENYVKQFLERRYNKHLLRKLNGVQSAYSAITYRKDFGMHKQLSNMISRNSCRFSRLLSISPLYEECIFYLKLFWFFKWSSAKCFKSCKTNFEQEISETRR